jgi:hypothetical protein
MFAVPDPPGNATTRSGSPSSNILRLRSGPAAFPCAIQSASKVSTGMHRCSAHCRASLSAPCAPPSMRAENASSKCNWLSAVRSHASLPNALPPHTSTLTAPSPRGTRRKPATRGQASRSLWAPVRVSVHRVVERFAVGVQVLRALATRVAAEHLLGVRVVRALGIAANRGNWAFHRHSRARLAMNLPRRTCKVPGA